MSRYPLLNPEEIETEMFSLPFWKIDGTSIVREFVFSNFTASIGFVNSTAIIAEAVNHHPDILIYGWNKVRITLTTYDSGGLTSLDFAMAKKIDELNF